MATPTLSLKGLVPESFAAKNPRKLPMDRIPNPYGVTVDGLKKMKTLVEGVMAGDEMATVRFKEAIAYSDAPYAFASLLTINALPQYAALPSIIGNITSRLTVNDFDAVRYYDIIGDFEKLQYADDIPAGVLPNVPEFAPYPEIHFTPTVIAGAQAKKRGAQLEWSWEEQKRNPAGFIQSLQDQLGIAASYTDDWAVTTALTTGVTDYSQLQAGKSPFDESTVPANAPLSIHSLALGIAQIRRRKVNGRYVNARQFILVVPPTLQFVAEAITRTTALNVTDGSVVYDLGGFNPLGQIQVQVDDWLTSDTAWYVIPAPGAAVRPALVQLVMPGEEVPDIRVNSNTGARPGGGQVAWTEGSYVNDTLGFRVRTVGGSALITEEAIVWSDGTAD